MTGPLFAELPVFPCAMPDDELKLLAKLDKCDWPTTTEVGWRDLPAARRLEKRGLVKIIRQKMDPVAIAPEWFAGKLPASQLRAHLKESKNG
jgi:hypothetical protein